MLACYETYFLKSTLRKSSFSTSPYQSTTCVINRSISITNNLYGWNTSLLCHWNALEDTSGSSNTVKTSTHRHRLFWINFHGVHSMYTACPIIYSHGLVDIISWAPEAHFINMVNMVNPSMDNWSHAQQSVGWNYLSISKLQRLHHWSLGMGI